MEFRLHSSTSFAVYLNDQIILEHSHEHSLFHVGTSQSIYKMHLGHFLIDHKTEKKVNLQIQSIEELSASNMYEILFADESKSYQLQVRFILNSNGLQIEFPSSTVSEYIRSVIEADKPLERHPTTLDDSDMTNLWIAIDALPFDQESIRGAGLQFTDGDLRQKILPIWVSEWYHEHLHPNNHTADRPTEHTTYHPQPTFVSSRGYTFCAYGSAYAQFDFSHADVHQLYFAAIPYRLELRLTPSPPIQYPSLPEWLQDGIILGMQGGTNAVDEKLRKMHEAGTYIAGVWAQDWCGKRITSFGKRVFWNWQWNENWYPNLKEKIVEWQHLYRGCRFLAYINPYIAADGSLFQEANEKKFLVRHLQPADAVYVIDFGEFNGAIVDLTNPEAFKWYKNVIRRNLLDLGISGWMADFGEYLPCDVHVYANIPGALVHNLWPILWARCNYEAIRDAGKSNEVVFFMRSGYLNVQRYCPLFWTGDQVVNFSHDAGLSVGIRSSLSLSLSHVLAVHMDIGGYFGRTIGRTREVLLRWCEIAAFNVIMRTHEGNRPLSNTQFDSDQFCIKFFARMSRIHAHLKPYSLHVIQEASRQGKSCITPHTELQYFFGKDLLIAPVVDAEVNTLTVTIPDGQWVHLWTRKAYDKHQCEIEVPLGQPAVFYRSTGEWTSLFEQIHLF
ncbi:unnamed protein product [Adineta ricciae]|uniref:Alpha-glucosidase n=2 Tax=Adineta ricciae TaxID=249248 RepID=A0A815R6M9_ADIRI|nr:unnamed protein product [Adineta ricciae]